MTEEISRLDTSQLKRRADELRVELREVEAELWRRTAVRLVVLPVAWADPSAVGRVLSGADLEDYVEEMHSCLEASLPVGCRPNKTYPWSEIWGPQGALGDNPTHHIRAIIAAAHETVAHRDGGEPWR